MWETGHLVPHATARILTVTNAGMFLVGFEHTVVSSAVRTVEQLSGTITEQSDCCRLQEFCHVRKDETMRVADKEANQSFGYNLQQAWHCFVYFVVYIYFL